MRRLAKVVRFLIAPAQGEVLVDELLRQYPRVGGDFRANGMGELVFSVMRLRIGGRSVMIVAEAARPGMAAHDIEISILNCGSEECGAAVVEDINYRDLHLRTHRQDYHCETCRYAARDHQRKLNASPDSGETLH